MNDGDQGKPGRRTRRTVGVGFSGFTGTVAEPSEAFSELTGTVAEPFGYPGRTVRVPWANRVLNFGAALKSGSPGVHRMKSLVAWRAIMPGI